MRGFKLDNFKAIRKKLGQVVSEMHRAWQIDKNVTNYRAVVYGYKVLAQIHADEKTVEIEERLTKLERRLGENEKF